ncbi:uncharacterized protein LOC124942330 [Impatiens glandulifera]|uniref:uncharacterized protein LOC124942330 n=1 Tax=Impatiens glandulifera TaxID=253017 RepID=UPI001FB08D4A|nr:uncharacterized protein LOC124942330 [Impatiens glandulifera]XP_047338769.1 uncharacterized protein LOC124942330 [Impatiens glandulifera]
MSGVMEKFVIASMLMWMVPIAILYSFKYNLVPGITDMSSYSLTLLSGFGAVISVNIIIAFYIYMAMKEPSEKHQPSDAFLAQAKASMRQLKTNETEDAAEARDKQE